MEKVSRKTTKLCSFYVSDWHLVTMLLPYLNEEINKVVAKQKELGFHVITDGEFRRTFWHLDFMWGFEGIAHENTIVTLLETNIKEKVETLVKKLNLKNSEQILNINWNIVRTKKYLELKNILNIESKGEENITILVNGRKKFIDNIKKNIERWMEQNKNVRNIKIINCYEITEFNYNITEILDEHDKILNTSGEREKEDVFEGYEKGMKIV